MKSIFTEESLDQNLYLNNFKNEVKQLQPLTENLNLSTGDFYKLIETTETPEQWIAFCFSIEKKISSEKLENLWKIGLDKFHKQSIYLESIGFFYFRIKLGDKMF